MLLFIKYYDGSNETLRSLHDMFALGSALESLLRPILDALIHAKGPSSAPAAAANNGGGLRQVAVLEADEEAPAAMEDYIQEHAGAILQALCHSQGLALDSPPFQEGIKEFAEGLRETLLNPGTRSSAPSTTARGSARWSEGGSPGTSGSMKPSPTSSCPRSISSATSLWSSPPLRYCTS